LCAAGLARHPHKSQRRCQRDDLQIAGLGHSQHPLGAPTASAGAVFRCSVFALRLSGSVLPAPRIEYYEKYSDRYHGAAFVYTCHGSCGPRPKRTVGGGCSGQTPRTGQHPTSRQVSFLQYVKSRNNNRASDRCRRSPRQLCLAADVSSARLSSWALAASPAL
jgi:hypothetical protein